MNTKRAACAALALSATLPLLAGCQSKEETADSTFKNTKPALSSLHSAPNAAASTADTSLPAVMPQTPQAVAAMPADASEAAKQTSVPSFAPQGSYSGKGAASFGRAQAGSPTYAADKEASANSNRISFPLPPPRRKGLLWKKGLFRREAIFRRKAASELCARWP